MIVDLAVEHVVPFGDGVVKRPGLAEEGGFVVRHEWGGALEHPMRRRASVYDFKGRFGQ